MITYVCAFKGLLSCKFCLEKFRIGGLEVSCHTLLVDVNTILLHKMCKFSLSNLSRFLSDSRYECVGFGGQ